MIKSIAAERTEWARANRHAPIQAGYNMAAFLRAREVTERRFGDIWHSVAFEGDATVVKAFWVNADASEFREEMISTDDAYVLWFHGAAVFAHLREKRADLTSTAVIKLRQGHTRRA